MRDIILKAVANPPKLFWGPVLPAALNAGIQIPFMFMAIGIWQINPLIFIISIVIGHLIVVALGSKDPHLSGMLQAFGTTNMPSTNLYRVKGRKFEP
ncbi:hypothetical protein IJ556_06785 [bacterium]|nr:hypothetical protein [bacterium]MBR2274241.1 hypothetical protein [Alphaproteobacteria bacterium]